MLRAVLKATDLCASDPQLVSRRLVEEGFAERYDYALQTLTELPYRSWREFDPEDSMRFYALRMHEIGFISASPTAVIAEGTEAAHEEGQRLQTLGAAPEFALTSQDGAEVTLASLRGKVVAVTFIYTSCPDVCPMLTDKLARVQDALGRDFGSRIAFVSITTDPERDTPEVLKGYAEAFEPMQHPVVIIARQGADAIHRADCGGGIREWCSAMS